MLLYAGADAAADDRDCSSAARRRRRSRPRPHRRVSDRGARRRRGSHRAARSATATAISRRCIRPRHVGVRRATRRLSVLADVGRRRRRAGGSPGLDIRRSRVGHGGARPAVASPQAAPAGGRCRAVNTGTFRSSIDWSHELVNSTVWVLRGIRDHRAVPDRGARADRADDRVGHASSGASPGRTSRAGRAWWCGPCWRCCWYRRSSPSASPS